MYHNQKVSRHVEGASLLGPRAWSKSQTLPAHSFFVQRSLMFSLLLAAACSATTTKVNVSTPVSPVHDSGQDSESKTVQAVRRTANDAIAAILRSDEPEFISMLSGELREAYTTAYFSLWKEELTALEGVEIGKVSVGPDHKTAVALLNFYDNGQMSAGLRFVRKGERWLWNER